MWKKAWGVREKEEDVTAEGQDVDFLGDGGRCCGSFDVGDEAGVAEGVSVGFSGDRHDC